MRDSGCVIGTQLEQNIDESSYICFRWRQVYRVLKLDPMQDSILVYVTVDFHREHTNSQYHTSNSD